MKFDVLLLLWSNPTQPALQKNAYPAASSRELNSGKVAGIVYWFEWTHRSSPARASFNQVEAQKKAAIRVAAVQCDF